MKKLIDIFKSNIVRTVQRFPIFLVLLTVFSLLSIYYIFDEQYSSEVLEGLGLGIMTALFSEAAYEYDVIKWRPLTAVLPALSTGLSILALKRIDNAYPEMVICGIGFALIGLFLWVLYRDRKNEKVMSHLIKSGFLCGVAASVINAGLLVCVMAFNYLIFKFDDVLKLIGAISILTEVLFYGMTFSSFIPKPGEEPDVPKVYRLLIHKGLFHIYLMLIGILYLYIGKVIIIHKMPVGKFNWFGCFALTFYALFYLTVDESDGKVQKWFKKYGALLMLPVIAVQGLGIYIRVSSYGLTTARYMSVVLILMALVFMIDSLLKLPVQRSFIWITILAVLFTCTPLNVIDMPNRNQEHRLEQALMDTGILKDGKINENMELSESEISRIRSPYEYLQDSYGKKGKMFKEFSETKFAENNFGQGYDSEDHFSFYSDLDGEKISVEGYKTMEHVIDGGETYDGVDLTEFFLNANPKSKSLVYKNGTMAIYFNFVDYEENDLEGSVTWEGYVLKK